MQQELPPAFCSWSGGKDSCLALHRARTQGLHVTHLVNMLIEDGTRSRSHGLRAEVIQAQADALGLRLVTANASWAGYEETFIGILQGLREGGISQGVFGDIDTEDHRRWEEKVCAAAGMEALLPLWQGGREDLLVEFLDAGFQATIVTVNGRMLSPDFLGRTLDRPLIAEVVAAGVDACGEYGEFHTVVTDGPLFTAPVRLRPAATLEYDGYWFLDMALDA